MADSVAVTLIRRGGSRPSRRTVLTLKGGEKKTTLARVSKRLRAVVMLGGIRLTSGQSAQSKATAKLSRYHRSQRKKRSLAVSANFFAGVSVCDDIAIKGAVTPSRALLLLLLRRRPPEFCQQTSGTQGHARAEVSRRPNGALAHGRGHYYVCLFPIFPLTAGFFISCTSLISEKRGRI